MEAKLGRVKIKKDKIKETKEFIHEFQGSKEDVFLEMNQKEYYWDSVFLKEEGDTPYLYTVLKFKKNARFKSTDEIKTTNFRTRYNKFITECWDEDSGFVTDMVDALWVPNRSLNWEGHNI